MVAEDSLSGSDVTVEVVDRPGVSCEGEFVDAEVVLDVLGVGTLRVWAGFEVSDLATVELATGVGDATLEIEANIDPVVMSRSTASLRSQQYLLGSRFSSQHQEPSEQF